MCISHLDQDLCTLHHQPSPQQGLIAAQSLPGQQYAAAAVCCTVLNRELQVHSCNGKRVSKQAEAAREAAPHAGGGVMATAAAVSGCAAASWRCQSASAAPRSPVPHTAE